MTQNLKYSQDESMPVIFNLGYGEWIEIELIELTQWLTEAVAVILNE